MGSSPNGVLASARHVTIVGHNSQIVPTVGFFVGGGMSVLVYTTQSGLEADLAPYPDVHVTVLPSYEHAPSGLLEPPYVVAVDNDDDALLIRSWLPPTTAVFLARAEQRRRNPLHGFLSLMPSTTTLRRTLLRRLTVLKRVDLLMNLARQAKRPLILMYSNPDPDAIGAALGLATIWRAADRDPLIRYTGEVQRYQNKLLLQYLKEEPIEHLKDEELAEADLIAVVDAQPGFWREDPPKAHVVIDHHPRREDTQALYVDLREGYGSTSSILTEYLVEADLPINKHLATALMYGLTTDTDDLNRHTGAADIRAFDELYPRADHHFLTRLDKAQVPMSVLDHIAWGISHRVVVRDLILIHFGEVPTADIMVQTADQLLLTYGINWTVCAGVKDHTLIVIFRGDGHRQDVGKRAALAFGKIGSAGGHRTMGRAEIPLGDEANELDSCEILVDNLFRKMSAKRRARFVRKLKSHLKGEGPDDHEEFEFAT